MGQPDRLITPHSLFEALGATVQARHSAYRELFRNHLALALIDKIRAPPTSSLRERYRGQTTSEKRGHIPIPLQATAIAVNAQREHGSILELSA